MGASLVIAVNVAADEPAASGPDSMFSLLGKTIDAMMAGGTRKALESADLVIDPNLEGLDSMAWRKSDDLAKRGYDAAAAMAGKLAPYAMSEADYAAFQAARQSRRRTEHPVIAFVDVSGLIEPLTDDVKQVIGQEFKNQIGAPLDPAVMREDILHVTGTDRYEYLTYRAIERDGRTGLNVIVRQKTYGPPFLAMSLELSNVDSSSFSVNFGGRITTYDILGAGSELRVDLGLGTHQIAAAELYRPIRRDSGFFVAPRGYFERNGLNVFSNGDYVAEYRVKQSGGAVDFGYTTNERVEVRLGYELADVRARRYIGDPVLPEVTGTQGSSRLQVIFDGQDSPIVPSRGFYSRSTLTHFDRTADVTSAPGTTPPENPDHFTQGEAIGTWFNRVRGQDRIFAAYGAGTSFGENPLYNVFRLGGPLRLGAFRSDEIFGANYVLGDLGYLKRIGRLPDVLGGNVFLGSWLETGSAWDEWKSSDWHNNISAGLVAESLMGPIFAGASFGKSDWRFFVAIGPLFK
jgi:NTE family protein